jgi:predicted type IV restriction endonuclease
MAPPVLRKERQPMETKQAIERISRLGEKEVGPAEENVKQKIVVPLLEILGHRREDLDFERRTRTGGRIDIVIKNVPHDCKVIIDTKNYAEQLADCIEQIRQYTFDENALLAVLVNGTEFRIYSLLKGVEFERSLLYLIGRNEIGTESAWQVLSGLLGKAALQDRSVFETLDRREREIKAAISDEVSLTEECRVETEGITSSIEQREDEIEDLRKQAGRLEEDLAKHIAEIWKRLGLPYDARRERGVEPIEEVVGERSAKAKRVRLQELVDAGLLRDGDRLRLFYSGRGPVGGEQARVVAAENKLKYEKDGQVYSVSKLAENLLRKHRVITHKYSVQGPLYWQTEEGKMLHDLNQTVRQRR